MIVQDYGLLGALVRRYELGITVDTTNPSELGRVIGQVVTESPRLDLRRVGEFLRDRTPETFARSILAELASVLQY